MKRGAWHFYCHHMIRIVILPRDLHAPSACTGEMMARKSDKYYKHLVFFICFIIILIPACEKDSVITDSPSDNGVGEHIEMEKPPYTPQAGNPGFFLDDWKPKYISSPDYSVRMKPAGNPSVKIYADFNDVITRVSKYLFGNNTNTYIGQMVNEPVLIDHIRKLSPNVIRFPGGNLSSLYFWNAVPGQPPDDVPDKLIDGNTGIAEQAYYWYGGNTESWTLSLDNYYQMLYMTETTGMITVNYSYARYGTGPTPVQSAAQLAADWVRYDNGRTKFWEIGNENAGPWQAGYLIDPGLNQDGQPERITGELYGNHFGIFADSMRAAAAEIGSDIKIGAQLIHFDAVNSWNPAERDWNSGYFSAAGNQADYYIVHDYFTDYEENSSPEMILNSAGPVTEDIMDWMNTTFDRHNAEMKPIAFTEWNIFSTGSRQMVSDISGMHAALALGEFIKNKFGMAARWNIANGWEDGNDHGMFNLGDEPGDMPKWNPRPDFFHMYYFQKLFGDHMVFSWEAGPSSSDFASYASSFSSGHTGIVIVNKSTSPDIVEVEIQNFSAGNRYYWYTIAGGEGAAFSRQVVINGQESQYVSGGPQNYHEINAFSAVSDGGITFTAPGRSVTYLLIDSE